MTSELSGKTPSVQLCDSDQQTIEAIKAMLFDSIGTDLILHKFVEAVGELLGSNFSNFTIHSQAGKIERIVNIPEPTPAQYATIPKINDYIDEQPVMAHFRANRDKISIRKISDFQTTESFRKTDLYRYGFGPLGFDHMLSAGAWDSQGRLYLLNLTHPQLDFKERHRTLLAELFPAFLKAFQLNNFVSIRVEEIRNVTSLTRSQKEILSWVGEGKTNQEISTITGLSHKTVEKHIGNICRALGFKKRLELLDYCVKQTRVHFPALDKRDRLL